jgi:CheY-like chemotaxis protein
MQDPKPSILIVEDDDAVRMSFAEIFKAMGYRVRSAAEGLAALAEMRQEVPDVLLSDLNMTGMSGFELLSVVRRRFPSIQVIAMSGMPSDHGVPFGVTADAFYQKGSGMAELMKILGDRPLPKQEHRNSLEPIWIEKNGHDTPGGEFVTIACPECFRTFPQPISGKTCLILDTRCVFCRGWILYAIVQPGSRVFPERWQPTSLLGQERKANIIPAER